MRYSISRNAPPPPPVGRPKVWGELPIADLDEGDMVEVPFLSKAEARRKMDAIRSYVGRYSRKTGRKFSVRLTKDGGIGIWRLRTEAQDA